MLQHNPVAGRTIMSRSIAAARVPSVAGGAVRRASVRGRNLPMCLMPQGPPPAMPRLVPRKLAIAPRHMNRLAPVAAAPAPPPGAEAPPEAPPLVSFMTMADRDTFGAITGCVTIFGLSDARHGIMRALGAFVTHTLSFHGAMHRSVES